MTAILWLLKSMSEHVITMVDEETNKISSNLRLYSKVSTYFYFSSSDLIVGVTAVCVLSMMQLEIATMKIKLVGRLTT